MSDPARLPISRLAKLVDRIRRVEIDTDTPIARDVEAELLSYSLSVQDAERRLLTNLRKALTDVRVGIEHYLSSDREARSRRIAEKDLAKVEALLESVKAELA